MMHMCTHKKWKPVSPGRAPVKIIQDVINSTARQERWDCRSGTNKWIVFFKLNSQLPPACTPASTHPESQAVYCQQERILRRIGFVILIHVGLASECVTEQPRAPPPACNVLSSSVLLTLHLLCPVRDE